MRTDTHRQGFSLIELMIYVGIMTMLLLLTSQFVVNTIRGQRRASEVQRVHQAVRRIVTILNNDLRPAQSITPANSVFDDDAGVLEFVNASGGTVRYTVSGLQLYRQVSGGPLEAMTTNVVDVETFRMQRMAESLKGLDSIRFTFTLSAGTANTAQFYRQHYVTAVTLR